jgi:formate dehydrogenase accessory protein FdhE
MIRVICTMKNHVEYLEKKRNDIEKEELLPGNTVDFYLALFDFQQRTWERYCECGLPAPKDGESTPVIEPEGLHFDEGATKILRDSLHELVGVICSHHEGLSFESFTAEIDSDSKVIDGYIQALLKTDHDAIIASAAKNRLTAEDLHFLLVNWLKPLFAALRERAGNGLKVRDLTLSRCPVCGNHPDMAMLNDIEEGKRYLHCALCEHEWPYKRISCTICGNEDQETLGFFTIDGNERHRIDYCDACMGYIKTLRLIKTEDPENFDLTVETVITAHLDSTMLAKGYSRP